jgi:HigB_toxin, RelE-like toxic component of a toxin-antitoxin system
VLECMAQRLHREALRAQTKEFLLKDSPNSVNSKIESFPASANFLTVIHQNCSGENPLRAWYTEAKKARRKGPKDIKAEYGTASILPNKRVGRAHSKRRVCA